MTTIALPIWLIGTAIGTPTVAFMWLIVVLWRKKRKMRHQRKPAALAAAMDGQLNGSVFQHDLCLMQIDAVFDGLAALIETERIKLKRMMGVHPGSGREPVAVDQPKADRNRESADAEGNAVAASARGPLTAADDEPGIDEIASRYGVSTAEAELAMKFGNLAGLEKCPSLNAVA